MIPADLVRAARRIMMTVLRGKITLVDDTGVIQVHQVDLGPMGPDGSLGIRDKTKALFHFGFTSNPPAKTDAVLLFVGGDRTNGLVIGHNHQDYRLKNLQSGDSALYDQRGAYAWFKATGLVIDAAGLDVTVQNAKNVTVTASEKVTVNCDTAEVNADTKATVTAPTILLSSDDVELGDSGGPAVARVGDSVDLTTGIITSGSAKVTAA
jgi:phage baseplate assembly protein V